MHRRGFVISPVIFVLVALLIGMVVWKSMYQLDLVPSSHPRASAIKGRIVTIGITTVAASIAIAGGIGAACYFAFGRSGRASNIGMSSWIVVPVLLLSFQAYATLSSTRPTPATKQTATPGSTESSLQKMREQLQRQSDQLQQQNERHRENARRLSEQLRPHGVPPRTSGPPSPPVSPSPSPAARPAPGSKAPDPRTTVALEKLETDLNTQATEIISGLEPVLTHIAKTPKSDRADLRKRIDEADGAKASLETLSTRFRAIIDEARSILENTGASDNAQADAIRFSNVIDAAQRSFACDSIIRILDQAKEEAEFLTANFGQWKVGREGKIEAKDFNIQSRANSSRFFIESWMKSKDQDLSKIRGK